MAFMVLGLIQLSHVLNVRSASGTVFNRNFASNRYLFMALAFSVVMQISVVVVPAFNKVFRTVQLTGGQWLITVGAAFLIIPLVEIAKFIIRRTPLAKE
jgi:Ca2+-transporting ATPase